MKYFVENVDLNNKNSKVFVCGWVYDKSCSINLYCGKKLIKKYPLNVNRPDVTLKFENRFINKKYGYRYTLPVPKKTGIIYITLETKNEKVQIFELNRTLYCQLILPIINFVNFFNRGIYFLWHEHRFLVTPKMLVKYYEKYRKKDRVEQFINDYCFDMNSEKHYREWIKINEVDEAKKIKFKYNPLISIVIPVYNIEKKYLSECINSVLNQKYQNFEICIADDCSTNEKTKACLKEYELKDKRIKVVYREINGHISECSNSALALATGEFVGLLDNDDLLHPNALYEVVKVLNKDENIDLIYTDEDKYLKGKRCFPVFKPDWSPDTLLSHNYLCHFVIMRKSILDKIKGFRKGYEGSQDFDLFLRFTEHTNNIYHIPKILYHWRMIPSSTAMNISSKSYVIENGKKTLEDALRRRKIDGIVNLYNQNTFYSVTYIAPNEPFVSIIITNDNGEKYLKNCLNSILKKTSYKNYEIIILDYDLNKDETVRIFNKFNKNNVFLKVRSDFNYAAAINETVAELKSEYIVLIDSKMEIANAKWLDTMLGYAMQKHIGAVGAKTLYKNDGVRDCGLLVGIQNKIFSRIYTQESRHSPGTMFRLLVPTNFSAISADCLMISREKFIQTGKFDEKLANYYYSIDLCLKLLENRLYNVALPQVEFYYNTTKLKVYSRSVAYKNDILEELIMKKKWSKYLNNDPFYSKNYSELGVFMLDNTNIKHSRYRKKVYDEKNNNTI